MPARDLYHREVKHALIKDGWSITHDPYTLSFGQKDVFVDLGAEQMLAAEKDSRKIAVEIKSFRGASDISDLEQAIGQYVFYRSLITRFEPERKLFLAVPASVFSSTLSEPIARPVIEDLSIALVAFEPQEEVITRWIPQPQP
ncbi:MAG: fatty-acid synthase [Chloroflexaceae bacterium]|nr:fatty-acid synthase [Chloroflexaceae bacterium]